MYSDLIKKSILVAYNISKEEEIQNISKISKIKIQNVTVTNKELGIINNVKNELKDLTTVVFDNVNFDGHKLNLEIDNLEIINIKIKDIDFENIIVKNSLKLDNTYIDSLEGISKFNTIKSLSITQGQVVSTDLEKVMIKVIPDYPKFDYMDKEQKNNILNRYECYTKKCNNIDLSKLEVFEELISFELNGFIIIDDNIKEIAKKEKLEILNFKGEFRKNLEPLTNLKNLKQISFKAFDFTTILELSKFLYMPNLETLNLEKINKVEDYLVRENKIKYLSVVNCNISRIDFLLFFPNIKEIDFSNNNIEIGMQDEILEYIKKDIKIKVENNPLIVKLDKVKLVFKQDTLINKLNKVLKLDDKEITEYDLFNKKVEKDFLNVNVKELTDILNNKIHLKLNLKKIEINIDEDIDINSYTPLLYELSQDIVLVVDNLSSIDISALEKLNHIKIRNKVDIIIKIKYDEKEYYNLSNYEYIINKINYLIESFNITKNINNKLIYNEEELTKEKFKDILNTKLKELLIYNEDCKITIENAIVEENANNKLYEILVDKLIKYVFKVN